MARRKTGLERFNAISRELHGWSMQAAKLAYVVEEPDYIANYAAGQEEVYMIFSQLYRLGMEEVGLSLLAAEKSELQQAKLHMHVGITRRITAKILEIIYFSSKNRTTFSSLDSITFDLFNAISIGNLEAALPFQRLISDALEKGYGVKNGHQYAGPMTLRYAAMGLAIVYDWLEQPLDLDRLGLSRDPAWGELVANWKEADPERLQPILMAACDVHMERIWLNQRDAEAEFEFSSPFMALHPTEILAVLRLRDALGLLNPTLDHPLMRTPYAQITARANEIEQRDEVVENLLSVISTRNPEIMNEWNQWMS